MSTSVWSSLGKYKCEYCKAIFEVLSEYWYEPDFCPFCGVVAPKPVDEEDDENE